MKRKRKENVYMLRYVADAYCSHRECETKITLNFEPSLHEQSKTERERDKVKVRNETDRRVKQQPQY